MESDSGLATTSGEDAILMQADQEQSSSDSGIDTTGRQRRRNDNNEGENNDNNDGRDPEEDDDDADQEPENGNHNDHHEPANPQADGDNNDNNDNNEQNDDGNQNNNRNGVINPVNNGNVEDDDAQPQLDNETTEGDRESDPDHYQHLEESQQSQASNNDQVDKLSQELLNNDSRDLNSNSTVKRLPQRSKSYHKQNQFASWSTHGDKISNSNVIGVASTQPPSSTHSNSHWDSDSVCSDSNISSLTGITESCPNPINENPPDFADTYENTGDGYAIQGEYDKALQCYRESLTIRQNTLGENHPAIADLQNSIGNI